MLALILASFVMVLTMFGLMARFGLRKFLGYSAVVDIAFTVLMFAMFSGTFSGIVAGAFAGLFMTGLLYVLKASVGYERLERVGWKIKWVAHPPVWNTNFVKGAFA